MSIVKESGIAVGGPRVWGHPFDEISRPAHRIWGDLDEPLVSSILPQLLLVCRNTPLQYLSDRSHLITVLDLLHRHLKGDPKRPVPIALTFGIHAVVMSIFVLQGDGDLARIAASTKRSYDLLFDQLRAASDRRELPGNSPAFYTNVNLFGSLEQLANPAATGFTLSEEVNSPRAKLL